MTPSGLSRKMWVIQSPARLIRLLLIYRNSTGTRITSRSRLSWMNFENASLTIKIVGRLRTRCKATESSKKAASSTSRSGTETASRPQISQTCDSTMPSNRAQGFASSSKSSSCDRFLKSSSARTPQSLIPSVFSNSQTDSRKSGVQAFTHAKSPKLPFALPRKCPRSVPGEIGLSEPRTASRSAAIFRNSSTVTGADGRNLSPNADSLMQG